MVDGRMIEVDDCFWNLRGSLRFGLVWQAPLIALFVLLRPGVATADPGCGNDVCEAGEDCSNCWADCACREDQVCDGAFCRCPEGSWEDDDGSCRSDCDRNACMRWDYQLHECTYECDPAQEWCDPQWQRCVPYCNRDQCQVRDDNGACYDRCTPEGRECNGFGGCVCPEGLQERQGICQDPCWPASCQYTGFDGECHDYCVENGGYCLYDAKELRIRSRCNCSECGVPDADGVCHDRCEPLGAECVPDGSNTTGWLCQCLEGTELARVGEEVRCKPKCVPERCEKRDPQTGECQDTCPAQGEVCNGMGACECPPGTHEGADGCDPDCDSSQCSYDGGSGCTSYCYGGQVCDGMGTCVCPNGMTWNGSLCSVACDPNACQVDDGMGGCTVACPSGATCNWGSCECPWGTYSSGGACVPVCDPSQCAYFEGWSCTSWCGGGQVCDGTGGCYCPGGTVWNGGSCVTDCNTSDCLVSDGMGGCVSTCMSDQACDGMGNCGCAGGTHWGGWSCVPDCNGNNCEVDDGWGGCRSWCGNGQVCNGGMCDCPGGAWWDGWSCVYY